MYEQPCQRSVTAFTLVISQTERRAGVFCVWISSKDEKPEDGDLLNEQRTRASDWSVTSRSEIDRSGRAVPGRGLRCLFCILWSCCSSCPQTPPVSSSKARTNPSVCWGLWERRSPKRGQSLLINTLAFLSSPQIHNYEVNGSCSLLLQRAHALTHCHYCLLLVPLTPPLHGLDLQFSTDSTQVSAGRCVARYTERRNLQLDSFLRGCPFFKEMMLSHTFLTLDWCLALEVFGTAQLVPFLQQVSCLLPQQFHHQALSRLDIISLVSMSGRKIQSPKKSPGKRQIDFESHFGMLTC